MTKCNVLAASVLACCCTFALPSASDAADWNGAWIDNASACGEVFVKKGGTISFAEDADLHGSGFIIEGNRVRGKLATCTIKSRKEDGPTLNFVAACSTDVAVQTVQFSLKVVDNNTITRMFPGLPELDTNYSRCAM